MQFKDKTTEASSSRIALIDEVSSNMAATQPSAYHNFMDYQSPVQVPVQGVIVPQEVYRNAQPLPQANPPVRFYVQNVLGIRLTDALQGNFAHLHGAGVAVPLTQANRISCRINWPGYEAWSDGMHIIDNNAQPYTLARLAQTIARTIRKFFNDNAHVATQEPRLDWAVNNIPFESLYLLELRHVSTGSWQPVISRQL
ncbi:hypothetical protein NM688_g3336 [Phlebia brevispora]|uniref:Uncharacterized protein n=1 Tax=Phlebia brevispora TaxID=194682 RepID=A0ACC1T6Q8_9APHY|nr:hypothetical protein NM688_g3336 [Phlebia brevispora]